MQLARPAACQDATRDEQRASRRERYRRRTPGARDGEQRVDLARRSQQLLLAGPVSSERESHRFAGLQRREEEAEGPARMADRHDTANTARMPKFGVGGVRMGRDAERHECSA